MKELILANELRIGNLYNDNGVFKKASPSTIEEVWNAPRSWCKAIPLTEEWLLKFLEVKKFGGTIYLSLTNLKAEIHFEIYKNDIVSIIKSDFAELILDPIKYVHQLQNLYFCLCGEELTI
jgi:hypothetical protein